MESLRLKLFQKTACYKKSFSFKVGETYPLPPYSTVLGLLHNILDADEFIPMQVSIQGDFESKANDLQTMERHKGKDDIVKSPLNNHLLFGGELIIHIKADKEVLEDIVVGIKNSEEYLFLGRREDLIRFDEVKWVEVEEKEMTNRDDNFIIETPIYIPKTKDYSKDLNGVNYHLNWKYKIISGIRQFEKINTKYVDEGETISEGNYKIDEDNNLVAFNPN